jgi:hypothetical protein
MKSDFEERKTKRLEAYQRLAKKNNSLSNSLQKQADKMSSVIPFGQPILIGHHSERRDRNFRSKISLTYGKTIEASNKSEYYNEKIEHMENSQTISSDDPDAVIKLKEKLEHLMALEEKMKAVNKIVKSKRAGYTEELKLMDLKNIFHQETEENLKELFKPDFLGRVGYPDYKLTNNNGNISRIKKRIEYLSKLNQESTTEEMINGIKIVDSVEDNRLQLYFPDKPSEKVRKGLKDCGFHWSRSLGCWQRFRSSYAKRTAQELIKQIQ